MRSLEFKKFRGKLVFYLPSVWYHCPKEYIDFTLSVIGDGDIKYARFDDPKLVKLLIEEYNASIKRISTTSSNKYRVTFNDEKGAAYFMLRWS